ncbi:MAG: serine protein kinase [Planctomycetaceae bacterium]|nr:serine protein kinase [Planctomycetota bacterium]NUN52599.1 serine protein kinase [Planctomycetaceae bacterium]
MARSREKVAELLSAVRQDRDLECYQELHWTGTFHDYAEIVLRDPRVARNAFQRLHDMILSHGTEEVVKHKERVVRYRFFSDPLGGGRDAVYGLERSLQRFVSVLKAAACGYGAERRILLLHGPVGSAKSTIVRLLKRGLEAYSRTPAGALYTFQWRTGRPGAAGGPEAEEGWETCPMHEEPLRLVPAAARGPLLDSMNRALDAPYRVDVSGDLCPSCRTWYRMALERCGGDWGRMIEQDVRVRRLVLSEKDRVGIGTFQPKDEKNQDSTELTGDINYRRIAEFGSDSDPRAFNFDGEFNIANRGLVEFIEVLKLDVAFLYDLLGASQEHSIKPKKFAQTDIDEVILGHTNEPEYRRLQSNELMEAFRDRTVKIDMPYNVELDDEVKIYRRDFGQESVRSKHIAPHTREMAAMWAVLTRLQEPKKANLSLLQKLKLYNGRMLPGYTEDTVRELREEAVGEAMTGISPRYVQDKISNALVSEEGPACINPFMVMNELESGLVHHSLITSDDMRKRCRELLALVKREYEDVIKNEVQRAISADEEAVGRLCANYVDNIKAYTQNEKLKNRYTGQLDEPDERLMRSIEQKIDIPDSRKDDFRREIMNYIGALAVEGRTFDYRTNERLQKALELKLFEDQKDSIKLTSIVSAVVDRETQEKIDVVKGRLVKNHGYCDVCATDVLNFVASIFARGDARDRDE